MRGSEFTELTAFLTVARERSFRRAALRLGLSPSSLSHMIRDLETRLGARLLNRTTRSVAVTEAGQALLARLEPALAEIEGAVAAVGARTDRPSGRLRLNLSRVAAHMILAPELGRFARTYPDILLELTIDDALTDVVAEGFDAGIRVGERVQKDMVAVRLTPDLRLAIVATPAYFARHQPPQTPRDLSAHACLNYRWPETGALYRWPFHGPDGPVEVAVTGPLSVNDTDLILAACLDSAGLACLPESAVAEPLADGRLVRVLADWCRPFPGFFLYYPGRSPTPPALKALVGFLRGRER